MLDYHEKSILLCFVQDLGLDVCLIDVDGFRQQMCVKVVVFCVFFG
jgi:hypothetical protein